MRIAEVIGKLTLSNCHPSVQGGTWLVAVPLFQEGLAESAGGAGRDEPLIVYDDLGANMGCRIAVSEGAEAAAPFHPHEKPIDAYNAAIFDVIDLSR